MLLESVYTNDCPCLDGDRSEIQRLIKEHVVWRGILTSIDVQKVEKVNDRQWIVEAIFIAAPFQIESESGRLIRSVPRQTDHSRFALARPTGHDQWLLGHVSPIE